MLELNRLEKALYNCHSTMNDFTCFCISRLPAQGVVLDDALIKQALYYMYKRHPLLRARIQVDGSNNKVFFNIPQESLLESDMRFESCKLPDSSRFMETVEKFTTKEFEYEKDCLLWRMMLIEQEDTHEYVIVLALALYITDGMNICTLSIELVNILNSILTNQVCDEMLATLPVIDHLYKLIEASELFTESDRMRMKSEEKNESKYRVSECFKDESDSGFKLNLLTIDREVSQNIIKQAKSKNIKLTGYLATAIIYALRELYKENNVVIQEDFNLYISASLRIRMNPEIDFAHCRYLTLSSMTSLLYSSLDQQNRTIWSDSVYANEVIKDRIDMKTEKRLFHAAYSFEALDEFNDLFLDRPDRMSKEELMKYLHSTINGDLLLSNIGSYVDQRKKRVDGPLKITNMHFGDTQTSELCNDCFLMFHVCTWNEQLMIQLSSCKREIASKYSDRLMELLSSVLKSSLFSSKVSLV